MIVRKSTGRGLHPFRVVLQSIAVLVFLLLFIVPLVTVACASLFEQWSGAVPEGFTWQAYAAVITDPSLASTVLVSIVTALSSTAAALVIALTVTLLERGSLWQRRVYGFIMAAPLTVPSVVIGLAILMTFSVPPFAINGTPWIVIVGHLFMLLPLAYQQLAAAVSELSTAQDEISNLLGASRMRTFIQVVLPQLRPGLVAAANICIATSMGELTVSMMVAPPQWRNMPLTVFALTSRGIRTGQGAALTIMLLLITIIMLAIVHRFGIPRRRHSKP